MAALQALGVPDDSLLRNPEQIPFPKPPPIQNPFGASDEDTPSMRELVQEKESHVKAIDLEVTSTFNAALRTPLLPPLNSGVQPTIDVQTLPSFATQPAINALSSSTLETDPTA